MTGKVVLKITAGKQTGEQFTFNSHDTFIFGRMNDCHVCIPDDNYISRHHFILEANPPDARIRDLGSLNGTYVNGEKIGSRLVNETPEEGAKRNYPQVDLYDGDEIKTGDTHFLVLIGKDKPIIQQIKCQRCGKDVYAEIGNSRFGEYLCAQCAKDLVSDPDGILHGLLDSQPKLRNQVQIPDYEILKPLGEGGMGVVYQVRHKKLGRISALKILLSKVAVSAEARNKFLREIKIAASLEHPNIVKFYDSGAIGSVFYIEMEYCDNGNLNDYMNSSGRLLSEKETIPIFLQVLSGLSYAHTKGFVHRDLKPQNILLVKGQQIS